MTVANSKVNLLLEPDMQASPIYKALYECVNRQASQQGSPLSLPLSAFVISTMQPPNYINIGQLENLSALDFLYSAYWIMLNRLPASEDIHKWLRISGRLKPPKFRQRVALTLSRSIEGRIKRAYWTDQPQSAYIYADLLFHEDTILHKQSLVSLGSWISLNSIDFMYQIYKKTLRPFKIYCQTKLKK